MHVDGELGEDELIAPVGATGRGPGAVKPLLVLSKIRGILDAFSLESPELSLSEIRAATGYPASTVQRLVGNLVGEGFLDRTTRGYRIGLAVAYWSAPATQGLDLVDVAHPVLRELRDLTGETACLFRLEGEHRVCVAMAETRHAIRREMHVGAILPLHAGSAGRVLLAWDDAVAERVLARELPVVASGTVTDPTRLRPQIARARVDGYAVSHDERAEGASGVSAPVFDSTGQVLGAINVLGPSLRVTLENCERWAEPVVAAALRVTRSMGGRLPA